MDDGDDDVQIIWHWNISSISFSERPRIERIARQLFQGEKAARIVLYREFGGGKSGATVLEVREHEEHDELRVSNVSILKVGQEHELHQEQDNYERLVKNRGTAAFMTIKRGGVSIGGVAGIVYQDAQHYLGIRRQERIDDVSALFRPVQDDLEMARERLDRLLVAHLHEVLYKHGARVDAGSLRPYVNEFLPAEYRVEVSRYEPDGEVIACAAGDAAEERLSAEVDIAEVDLGLRVEGRIAATRRDFYDSLLPRLGVTRRGRFLWVDGARVGDPAGRTDEFLRREHYSFVMSPVHGDLHAGNVLLGGDGFGIIDYGRMRARFPALYDIAYLYADLKSRFVADRFDIPTLVSLEESILYGARRPRIRRHRGDARQLELFEYGALPEEMRLLGSPATYYSLLGLILLGRLKFDVPEVEKRAGLVLPHYAFERAR